MSMKMSNKSAFYLAIVLFALCFVLLPSKLNEQHQFEKESPPEFNLEEQKTALEHIKLNIQSRRLATSGSSCNLTRYAEWLDERYIGYLATDSTFWMYQTQTQIELNNYFALNLALRGCQRLFDNLILYRAGRMGPITIQDSYKIMCRDYCLENDNIHEIAMSVTGCSCLELSTASTDPSYTVEGDWCRHNTARLLCDMIGYCGVWDCRIDDFMCPRYEWNKKIIPLKGPGTCIRGVASGRFGLQHIIMAMVFIIFTWVMTSITL